MLRQFLIAFTAVFAGGLAVEVLNYHLVATLEKDRWAMVPQLSGTLLVFAALLALAWPIRRVLTLFVICCLISIATGLAGVGFHLASHGLTAATLGTATSWFGDPPPLAPLEFAVVGTLGLLAVMWSRGGTLVEAPLSARILYAVGALSSFIALILAAMTAPSAALIALTLALVVGACGYVVDVGSRLRAGAAT